MKSRSFSGSWPNFLCRLFVVVILLQDISAQPVSNQKVLPSPPDDRRLPSSLLERRPPPPHRPPKSSSLEHSSSEKVPGKSKTPHPVFLPYTVPIPWPTPFNGTDFAPVPAPIRPQKIINAEIPRDTDPIFFLLPQFEFVPLYYNPAAPQTTTEPARPVEVTSPEKPTPRPKPAPKSQPKSAPKPQPKPTVRILKATPVKPSAKPSDPVREPRPTAKGFVSPPKHTWTPPPEDVPEYIPPLPSNLHTRSSESYNDKDSYDYVAYEPQYYTISDDGITYSPEIYSYTTDSSFPDDPYRYKTYGRHYYDQPNYVTFGPDTFMITEPTLDEDGVVIYGPDTVTYTEAPVLTNGVKPPSPPKRPTYITYGPDYITYTEPRRYEGGYIINDPETVTYTEDAPFPFPARPTRPSLHRSSSRQPSYGPDTVTITEPLRSDDEYITLGPNIAVNTDDVPISPRLSLPTYVKSPRPSFRPPPNQPSYVTYGPDRNIITEPPTIEDGHVTYESGVDTHSEAAPVPPFQKRPRNPKRPSYRPRPSRPYQQPVVISSRSFPAPKEPEEKEGGNVYFGPDSFTVVEKPDGEKSVIYDPEIVSIHEDEPRLEPPGEDPNLQYYEVKPQYDTYYEEDPGYETFYEEEPPYDTFYEPQENSRQPPS